jgi:RNA polymerase sigma-70 factor (ECF subfamily)
VTSDPRLAVQDHLQALRAFAVSLSGDPVTADDLVQDTIVKAWTSFDKFEAGTNLRAWLFTILRNTFFSDLRKRRREVPDPDGFHASRLSERPAHDGRLAMAEFRVAFARLSPEHREALILVGASGFSYEEVAAMTGVAIGTVKSRVNRARARLAEALGLRAGEDPVSGDDGVMLAASGISRASAA